MISTAFTEFRKNTSSFLDKVENGETVIITRHGHPIAEIIPITKGKSTRSWKRTALRMKINGVRLSHALAEDREKE
ncbi:MAG: type II toxin-antitoxin system Phd/YefM family antitoxin [Chitinivibrionales bacterium]|nr:type II toxin-antitoxin system Phd/YefM family antitoxin [Chitinivibrionales bacterium]